VHTDHKCSIQSGLLARYVFNTAKWTGGQWYISIQSVLLARYVFNAAKWTGGQWSELKWHLELWVQRWLACHVLADSHVFSDMTVNKWINYLTTMPKQPADVIKVMLLLDSPTSRLLVHTTSLHQSVIYHQHRRRLFIMSTRATCSFPDDYAPREPLSAGSGAERRLKKHVRKHLVAKMLLMAASLPFWCRKQALKL